MKHSILFSVGSMLFFCNFASADTIEVAIANKTNESCLFWSPSKTQFSTLIKNVRLVVRHEDKTDTSQLGRTERKNFLSYLKDWRTNPYQRFNIVLNGLGFNDLCFYHDLHELIKFSDAGDLYMLQSLLIAKSWPMHVAHDNGNFVPIWTAKKTEAFYAAKAQQPNDSQPTEHRAESSTTVTSVPDTTNNNPYGL